MRRALQSSTGLIRTAAAVAVAVLFGGPLLAGAAGAATPGGIGLAPNEITSNLPAAKSYFILDLEPGAQWSGHVVVTNTQGSTADLSVAAVDGITATASGAVFSNNGAPLRGVSATHAEGSWLSVGSSQMSVPTGARQLMPFSVSVPADATPGDHLAGVAFWQPSQMQSHGSGATHLQVKVITRNVMSVLIHVGEPGNFVMGVGQPTIGPDPATQATVITVPLTNKGNDLGKPSLSISVTGPNNYHHTITTKLNTVLPGDSINFVFPWPDGLAPGTYVVQTCVSPVDGTCSTSTVVLDNQTFAPSSGADPTVWRPVTHGISVGEMAAIGGGVLVLGAGAASFLWWLLLDPGEEEEEAEALAHGAVAVGHEAAVLAHGAVHEAEVLAHKAAAGIHHMGPHGGGSGGGT